MKGLCPECETMHPPYDSCPASSCPDNTKYAARPVTSYWAMPEMSALTGAAQNPVNLKKVETMTAAYRDQNYVVDELLDALGSMLIIEGPALVGGRQSAFQGLDIKWHFEKARAAIALAQTKRRTGF